MKTSVSLLGIALLALGGCHHHDPAAPALTVDSPGIVVSQARLVLPAVKGNPGAAYFTLGNHSSTPATLVGVVIAGAKKAEMHQTSGGTMQPLAQLRIDPGSQVIFAPGGKHVMAFNLEPTLAPYGNSVIVFVFQDGKTKTAPISILSAGNSPAAGNMAGMPGMDTGGHN